MWSEAVATLLTSSPLANVLMIAFSIWLLGLTAFFLENRTLAFIGSLPVYGFVFLFLPALFLGTRYFHRSYLKGIDEFQPYLKLQSDEFTKLKHRLNQTLCDSRIVISLGILAFVVLEDNFGPCGEGERFGIRVREDDRKGERRNAQNVPGANVQHVYPE